MQAFATALHQASPFAAAMGQNELPRMGQNAPDLGTCSLFVKGLAKGVNERQLHTIFSTFGCVINCQVARHRSGRSAGFAVLTFARREDAGAALMVMENAVLAGRKLNVRWYTPELQQSMGDMNFAQTLAALLTGQQQAPPPPPKHQHMQANMQVPWLPVPEMQAHANARAHGAINAVNNQLTTQALVQLASALVASQSVAQDTWAPPTATNINTHEEHNMDSNNKWANVPSAGSANSSIPPSSPNNRSDDGSNHMGTGMHGKLHPEKHRDGLQAADMMIREDYSESGARLGQHNGPFDWPPSLTSSSLSSLRSSATGTGLPGLPAKPCLNNLASVFQAPGGPLPYASPRPGQNNNAPMQQLPVDLATALSLLFPASQA